MSLNRSKELEMSIFDAQLLNDESSFGLAVSVLEDWSHGTAASMKVLIEGLSSVQHLFEFMFSGAQTLIYTVFT